MARLLGRQETPGPESRLLLLSGREAIGLSVDRVGALAHLPAPKNVGAGAAFGRLYAVEDSALRVLDLEGLLRREFARAPAERRAAVDPTVGGDQAEAEAWTALLAFDLMGQTYALPLEEVSEVLTLPERLAAVAGSDDAVLGVHNLRGRLLPVVSLRRLLGLGAGADEAGRIVVTRVGDAIVGLAVERLHAILRVSETDIDAAPAVPVSYTHLRAHET